jgi:hypothetical protein
MQNLGVLLLGKESIIGFFFFFWLYSIAFTILCYFTEAPNLASVVEM